MGALFDEVADPSERKRKLIENGQLVTKQAREGLAAKLDAKQSLAVDDVLAVMNSFTYLGLVLKTVGELD